MAWTTESLGDHLNAEINAQRSATAADDRLYSIVREALTWVWMTTDWRFRRKTATLTTVASTATVDMPDDFAELDYRWLKDTDYYSTLRFTDSIPVYQGTANLFESGDEGIPRIALIVRDTGVSASFKWHFLLTPTPDDAYTYDYWYLVLDPLTAGVNSGSAFADSSSPIWPSTFDEGWRLRAKYNAERAFYPTDSRWEATHKLWKEWYAFQVAENNETMSRDMERIRDAYGDFNRTSRAGFDRTGVFPAG